MVCLALLLRLPARIRTWDPLIKSQLLYQLSYGEGFVLGVQIYKIIPDVLSKTTIFQYYPACAIRLSMSKFKISTWSPFISKI